MTHNINSKKGNKFSFKVTIEFEIPSGDELKQHKNINETYSQALVTSS